MSVGSASVTSSRKRKRQIQWEDVVDKFHQRLPPDFNKVAVVADLTENVGDVSKFLDLTPRCQQSICIDCGIEGWTDTLIDEIKSMVR